MYPNYMIELHIAELHLLSLTNNPRYTYVTLQTIVACLW